MIYMLVGVGITMLSVLAVVFQVRYAFQVYHLELQEAWPLVKKKQVRKTWGWR